MKSNGPAAGLYVHIPFCLTKCPYCDFFSITEPLLIDQFLEALVQESALCSGQFEVFDSLYIGGGTPSLLSPKQMSRLFSGLRSSFRFNSSSEITVEVNPDDVTKEQLRAFLAEGVNRLSIGVQSFHDRDLAFLKRRHRSQAGRRAIASAADAGFENISIDLIYALPNQTKSAWLNDLEQAVAYPVSHISCYQLTLEQRTPFGQMRQEGRLKTAGERKERDLFLLTSQFLEDHGFAHYEISNYAKAVEGTDFSSRHNTKYWTHAPYLGLGPSAHSFDGAARRWNCRSVEDYCKALRGNRPPTAGREGLTTDQLRLERLYLGFRTKIGVSRGDLEDSDNSGQTLSDLVDSGLLEVSEERIVCTRKGFLIADYLPLLFS